MSEYFLQQKFKARNPQKEKSTRKERSAQVGSSPELPKANTSDTSLGNNPHSPSYSIAIKSPQMTDRDLPYYNSYQSPKTGESSIYQIMQSINKNTAKSASYLIVQPNSYSSTKKNVNRSKSPTSSTRQIAQQPSSATASILEVPKSPAGHKQAQSALQGTQDRYNLASTSQEISKRILQNLRQAKPKSEVVSVRQVDPSSFAVNTMEQEKMNCDMCFRKDTKYFRSQQRQQPIESFKAPLLAIHKLEPLSMMVTSSDQNDITLNLINLTSQLNTKFQQLRRLFEFKDSQWRELVTEMRDELKKQKSDSSPPTCFKTCDALLALSPVDVQFENLMTQTNQLASNKQERIIRDLYSKIQTQNNSDLILKQLAQNGKSTERTYLKLIEDLRQKCNKQQKQIADQLAQLCELNAKLAQVQVNPTYTTTITGMHQTYPGAH